MLVLMHVLIVYNNSLCYYKQKTLLGSKIFLSPIFMGGDRMSVLSFLLFFGWFSNKFVYSFFYSLE